MADEQWHVIVEGAQQGPYSAEELGMLSTLGVIDGETRITGDGWFGWSRCDEVLTALRIKRAMPAMAAQTRTQNRVPTPDMRAARIRLPIRNDIIALLHDGITLIRATPLDVSSTGVLVSAPTMPFPIGSRLTVTIKAPGIIAPFSLGAQVVRWTQGRGQTRAFALTFDRIPSFPPALPSSGEST